MPNYFEKFAVCSECDMNIMEVCGTEGETKTKIRCKCGGLSWLIKHDELRVERAGKIHEEKGVRIIERNE
jgi:hypothetical protein